MKKLKGALLRLDKWLVIRQFAPIIFFPFHFMPCLPVSRLGANVCSITRWLTHLSIWFSFVIVATTVVSWFQHPNHNLITILLIVQFLGPQKAYRIFVIIEKLSTYFCSLFRNQAIFEEESHVDAQELFVILSYLKCHDFRVIAQRNCVYFHRIVD